MVFKTQTDKRNAIIGTAVTTAVGVGTLATGTALAISSKNKYNKLSKASIATLVVGSVFTAGGGIAVTILSISNVDTNNGNKYIYLTGSYSGTNGFIFEETGSLIFTDNVNPLNFSGNSSNTYLAKYNTDGTCLWATSIASKTQTNSPEYLLVDASGNSYLTGTYSGSNGKETDSLIFTNTIKLDYSGGGDAGQGIPNTYLAKYDTSGICLWAKSITSKRDSNSPKKLVVDSSGNSYLTGTYSSFDNTETGSLIFTDNVKPLDYGGGSNYLNTYLAKYDTNGKCQWANSITSKTLGNIPVSLLIDSSDNSYLTGFYTGPAVGETGSLIFTDNVNPLNLTGNSSNTYLAKYDSSGKCQWATSIASRTKNNRVLKFVLDSRGNSYLMGSYVGTIGGETGSLIFTETIKLDYSGGLVSNNSSTNTYLAKYDSSGTCLWAKSITSKSVGNSPGSLFFDSRGNIYLTGLYFGTNGGETGSLIFSDIGYSLNYKSLNRGSINTSFNSNTYLVKYDTNGKCQWANSITSKAKGNKSVKVIVDSSDNIYLTGAYYSLPGEETGSVIFSDNVKPLDFCGDFSNTYLAKYDSSGKCQWATSITSKITGRNEPNNLFVDSSGNSYLTGSYTDGQVNGSSLIFTDTTQLKFSGIDLNTYLAKYDTGGNFLWAKSITSKTQGNKPVSLTL